MLLVNKRINTLVKKVYFFTTKKNNIMLFKKFNYFNNDLGHSGSSNKNKNVNGVAATAAPNLDNNSNIIIPPIYFV